MKKTNHIRLLGSHTIDHTVVLVSQILKALVEHSDVSEWRDFELSVRSKFLQQETWQNAKRKNLSKEFVQRKLWQINEQGSFFTYNSKYFFYFSKWCM